MESGKLCNPTKGPSRILLYTEVVNLKRKTGSHDGGKIKPFYVYIFKKSDTEEEWIVKWDLLLL